MTADDATALALRCPPGNAGGPAAAAERWRRLTGGKNNRVFRVDDGVRAEALLWDSRDPRDRLGAECAS